MFMGLFEVTVCMLNIVGLESRVESRLWICYFGASVRKEISQSVAICMAQWC